MKVLSILYDTLIHFLSMLKLYKEELRQLLAFVVCVIIYKVTYAIYEHMLVSPMTSLVHAVSLGFKLLAMIILMLIAVELAFKIVLIPLFGFVGIDLSKLVSNSLSKEKQFSNIRIDEDSHDIVKNPKTTNVKQHKEEMKQSIRNTIKPQSNANINQDNDNDNNGGS